MMQANNFSNQSLARNLANEAIANAHNMGHQQPQMLMRQRHQQQLQAQQQHSLPVQQQQSLLGAQQPHPLQSQNPQVPSGQQGQLMPQPRGPWNLERPTQRLGSAILRLLNYSEQLNSFEEKHDLKAWRRFIDDFYIDPAMCTHALPCQPDVSFELPTPLLPQYYHSLHSQVTKLNLTFHDAQEYYNEPSNHVVECPRCTLCYYFDNGTKIEMIGRLRVVFTPGPPPSSLLKIESWEFKGDDWNEWLHRGQHRHEGSMSIPTCRVSDRGITAQHMRFLEISDVLGQMSPLLGRQHPRIKLEEVLMNRPSVLLNQSNGASIQRHGSNNPAQDQNGNNSDEDAAGEQDDELSMEGISSTTLGHTMKSPSNGMDSGDSPNLGRGKRRRP